jgi:hypothetical protein
MFVAIVMYAPIGAKACMVARPRPDAPPVIRMERPLKSKAPDSGDIVVTMVTDGLWEWRSIAMAGQDC